MSTAVAFWTGLLGVAVLVTYVIIGGATYPDYNHLTQNVSELGAIDAPHKELISQPSKRNCCNRQLTHFQGPEGLAQSCYPYTTIRWAMTEFISLGSQFFQDEPVCRIGVSASERNQRFNISSKSFCLTGFGR